MVRSFLVFGGFVAGLFVSACGLLADFDPQPQTASGVDASTADSGPPMLDASGLDATAPTHPGTLVYVFDPTATTCPMPTELDPAAPGCVSYEQGIGTLMVEVSLPTYTEVWGVVRGLQQQTPDAFDPYYSGMPAPPIDDIYVDGVSITTGMPRRHVFTLAAGLFLPTGPRDYNACPCDDGAPAPPFLGESWVCETGNNRDTWDYTTSYYEDVLWDADALGGSTCTPLGAAEVPGEFHVVLTPPASGPLEVRFMQDTSDDMFAVTELRLWVR